MSEPTQAEAKAQKKVKIKLLQDCIIGKDIKLKGTIVDVEESRAKELCDKKYPGYPPFYGYKPSFDGLLDHDPLATKKIVKAIRVA